MRRFTVPVAFALVTALAGCQGLSSGLTAGSSAAASAASAAGTLQQSAAGTGSPPGGVTAGSGALTLLVEPAAGLGPIDSLITRARQSIELTMYTLRDTTTEQDLTAAAKRGVNVRVILDQHYEKKFNTPAYTYLSRNGVHVTWAPKYTTYHQKTLTVDDQTSAIMTLNMNSDDYANTRDFAVIDTNKADVAAIVTTFNADWAHKATKSYVPPNGTDLVWSPTNSQDEILAVIGAAKKSLAVENEEMGDKVIVSALVAAAKRGVNVTITMTAEKSYDDEFTTLVQGGAHVRTYRDSVKVIYIHAKAVIADAGLSDQQLYTGSENFSQASLRVNRELGIRTTDRAVISGISATLAADYAGATPFKP